MSIKSQSEPRVAVKTARKEPKPTFSPPPLKKAVKPPSPESKKAKTKRIDRVGDTVIPRNHDTTTPLNQDIIEIVRKAVKELGKEAATYRFTKEEKRVLSDIVYQYKGQGIKTSENQITRIAINYLTEDYHQNGENSILAKVIESLNA